MALGKANERAPMKDQSEITKHGHRVKTNSVLKNQSKKGDKRASFRQNKRTI